MAEADGVKRRAVPSQLLQEALHIARRMVEASGVKRRAVPRQLLQEARHIARRMVEANAADRWTASTSLWYAACTAGSVQRTCNRAIHRRHHREYSSLLYKRP